MTDTASKETKTAALTPPTRPGEWTVAETVAALSRPIPDALLKEKKIQGNVIRYLPWHRACTILDKYAPGWSYEIIRVDMITGTVGADRSGQMIPGLHDRLVMTVRLTIGCSDGIVTRDGSGTELLSMSGYGDPSSNAESMALRRAASKFGLARHLYEG